MTDRKPCFLRESVIVLLDGQPYTFRALPLNKKTVGIIKLVMDDEVDDGSRLEGLVLAIEKSLSYDQDESTIEYIMENGLIPMSANGEEGKIHTQVMNAMVSGLM